MTKLRHNQLGMHCVAESGLCTQHGAFEALAERLLENRTSPFIFLTGNAVNQGTSLNLVHNQLGATLPMGPADEVSRLV